MNNKFTVKDSGIKYIPTEQEIKTQEKYKQEQKQWYKFPLTFWELVDKLNWKEHCNDDIHILQEKFRTLCENNSYVMKYFAKFGNCLRQILQNTLLDYELKTYGERCSSEFFIGGDDSWDDFANHIIGLGYDTYFDVLSNPEKAKDYMDEYVESFTYCFHPAFDN